MTGCWLKNSFTDFGTGNVTRYHTVILSTYFLKDTNQVQPASYPYKDYVPFPSTQYASGNDLLILNTTVGCAARCTSTSGCVGYVSNNTTNQCFLKSIAYKQIAANSDCISYYQVKLQRNYTIFNSIFGYSDSITFFNGDRSQCRQACDSVPGCIGYVLS